MEGRKEDKKKNKAYINSDLEKCNTRNRRQINVKREREREKELLKHTTIESTV